MGDERKGTGSGMSRPYRLLCMFTIALAMVFCASVDATADVIIDNGDPGTSFTGQWPASGGTAPYDGDSLWSRDGATYTWAFSAQPAGSYEVFMWWSGFSSRTSSAQVRINHEGGPTTVYVNQRLNAGTWFSLGTFPFGSSGSVTITAATGSTVSTCADAVRYAPVGPANTPPSASITSILPNPADVGEVVSFEGSGFDPDGGSIAAYRWESDIDGVLGESASFTTIDLSQGTHHITFTVRDDQGAWSVAATATLTVVGPAPSEVIIDNRDQNTSRTGTWSASGATGFWAADSVWSRDGATFTWTFNAPESASYDVFMWSTYWASRTTSARVDIQHSGGTSTVYVNQRENTSQWYKLGRYAFDGGTAYRVTITAATGSTVSTCADAVRFLKTEDPSTNPPVANFSSDRTSGGVPTMVQFYDQSTGTVTGWLWDFGDGQTSGVQNPLHQYTAAGSYTVSLTASNAYGDDVEVKTGYIDISSAVENIYLVDGYSKNELFLPRCYEYLRGIGAVQQSDGSWLYTNTAKGKTYKILAVSSAAGMRAALREPGAHIVFQGHSNFGLGATFATSLEVQNQQINNIYYVNDDRFVNYSTKMVSLKTDGMRYGQAYPNWNPIFKDGRSAMMPYDFPQGTPPYNYFLTYQIPGDPAVYRVELSDGTYLERFPDSNTPAWFSASGAAPDPVADKQYFITNSDPDWSRCVFTGIWPTEKVPGADAFGSAGYLGYNYQYHAAGSGQNKATYTIFVRHPGTYSVMASWPASTQNATNAKFAITHAGGTTTVVANQRVSALYNVLGTFSFNRGAYTVQLSDAADGRVVADAIIFQPVSGPSHILTAEFGADVISGSAPLNVRFSDFSEIYDMMDMQAAITGWLWDFGDGTTSTLQNPEHRYAASGVYTVKLTVTDSLGNQAVEEKTGLVAVGSAAPLRAEFSAANRLGSDKTIVNFIDQSSGNITSRLWNFGDGSTSTERNPTHAYSSIGTFNVTLTVSGPSGSDSEVEEGFVNNLIALEFVDNTFVEKPHFYSGSTVKFGKVIVDAGDIRMRPEEMKFSRMIYGGCNASNYYVEAFNRGTFFFTTADEMEISAPEYLRRYLLGDSDDQILSVLNGIEPIWQYYNFNLKPPSMR